MSEYTPTTDEVREAFNIACYEQTPRQSRAEFNRWLASVKAEAFREGYDHSAVVGAVQERHGLTNAEASHMYRNPYEEA